MFEHVVYYAYPDRDGKNYVEHELLTPWLALCDYLLFDSAEACIEYWEKEGIEVLRHK